MLSPEIAAGSILVLLFSVIIHEVLHGLAALHFGDRTAKLAGRLTLNPLPHIDPIGTILLPALAILSGSGVIFGWAKPVPVNPLNFQDIKTGEAVVAVAGILGNLALAVIAAILFHTVGNSLFYPFLSGILTYAVQINLVLAFFNLLPIPPLDGSKLLMTVLPYDLARAYAQLERYGFLILIFLLFTPFGSIIWGVLGILINLCRGLLGV